MKQDRATELVADALDHGLSNWYDGYGVAILTPVPGVQSSVVLVRVGDMHLSVTVEVLVPAP